MADVSSTQRREQMRRAVARRQARWGRRRFLHARFGLPLALALGSGLAGPAFAQNLPQGGTVTGGSGTIQQVNPNLLTIQQNTQNLAIDWQSFSVGAGSIVRFMQPSSSAIALNRVIGNDPSMIYGQIQANGQVILLNPRGIYFGPNSSVDVNALVATTANIRNDDFMAGRLRFDEGSSDANARVVNEGLISVAQGGFAVLAAASVQNTGRIVANGGSVVLAGTKTFTVDFHGDGLLSFAATGLVEQAPSGASALVENSGVIEANGGRVLMTARAARNVLDNVINTTGIVVAQTAQMVNGEIVIDGGDNGIVSVNGLVDASGRGAGETGGTVKVLGEKVGLFQNARLDVSGDAGGGTALVGGNYQGKGPEANARMVYMDAAAVIDAGAINSGDGGRVIVWSDDATRNYGHINVSGARDGGFIEVSSKGYLDFAGTVDLRGVGRNAGTLLLDPADITIQTGVDSNLTGSSPFQSTGAASSNLTPVTLLAALLSGNVTVTTSAGSGGTGNITINSAVAYVSAVTRTLTLQADNNITISGSGSISSTLNPLTLNLWAANNIAINGSVNTNNGSIVTSGQAGTGSAVNFSNTGAIDVGSGSITLNQSGTISFDATVTSTGTITLNNGGAVTQTAGLDGTGTLALGSGSTGAVTLNNVANAFNTLSMSRTGTSTNVSLLTAVSPTIQTSTLGTGTFSLTGVGFAQGGAITQDVGGGTVDIIGGTGSVTLSSANTFTGALTVTSDSITASTAQTAANVTLKPYTASTNITFNNGGGGLALSAATIGNFSGATDLTIGSTSAGTLTVAAAYSAPSNQNLSLISGGTMTVGNTLTTSGTGWITLNSAKNVAVTSNLMTAGGDIVIEGNVTSWASVFTNTAPTFGSTAGNFAGVSITGATISAGGGDIAIAGKGGTTGINQMGVYLGPSTAITATGAGVINIVGLAGPSTSDTPGSGGSHTGLYFNGGAAGTFVDISTVNGNIALTGTGAGSGGATDNNAGVGLIYTKVRSTGIGDIDVTGTGGVGGSRGVALALAPTEISTVSGDITIFGTGGSGYNATGYGFASQGVDLGTAIIKTTGAGDISIRAIAGPSSSAMSFSGTNVIGDSLMTGDLTMRADSYTVGGTLSITHQNATGIVEFRPDADATTIGAVGGTGVAQIPTALLASVTNFGTLKIGSATQSGAIDVGMWTPTGNIYLQTTGAISTDALTMAANTLTIDNGGAYTQVGGITGTGLVTFLGTGAVTATDPGNSFTNAALTKTGGAAVSLTTTGALDFATTSVGSSALNITAAGITQSGTITTSGAAFFNAGANAIALGSINALTGTVRFFNSGANNVNFMNGATNFGGGTTTVGGNLVVNAAGNLTQASALSVAGNATFTAGGNAITLTNASNAVTGNVTFSNAADTVSWREAAAVSLASSSSAALSVQAGGAITQAGALTVTGAASFSAGANAITLTNASNALSGSVTLINTGANNVQLTNAGAIDLNGSSVGGNLTLVKTGAGDITQSTPLTVGGTLSADAGSGLITLNQGANSITGAVSLSSTNVGTSTFQNGGPLVLGTVNITGNLDATGNSGAITQSGVITTGGNATFTTGGYAITLANVSNAVGGSVALNNTGANAVSWQESGAVSLAASSVGGNLTVTSGGAMTQSGALTVGGNAAFTTGGFAITLTHGSNAVAGDVNFINTGANAVSWNEAAAVSLGASNVGGSFTVTAGGAITQNGTLTVGGTSSFTTGASNITLDNFGNNFTGAVSLSNSGASATTDLWAGSNLVLGTINAAGGALTLKMSGGATITQTGAIMQAAGGGAVMINAITGDAALSQTNSFSGDVTVAGLTGSITAAQTVTGAGKYFVFGPTTSASLGANITTNGGQIGFQPATTLTANATLNSGSGNIYFSSTLDGAYALTATTTGSADFFGAVGGTTALTGLTVSATGVSLQGDVTTTGAQSYTGSAGFAGGAVVLTGNGISFANAVSDGAASVTFDATAGTLAFGGAVTLAGINALATGGITLGGDVTATTGALSFGSAFSTTGNRTISSPTGGMNLAGGSWTSGTLTLVAPFIDLGGSYTSTGGALSATADVSVNVASATITTNGGNITLSGNASGLASGDFSGVELVGSTLSAGGGNISMIGIGGDDPGAFQHGILISNTAVTTTGAGTITLTGTGGDSTGGISVGVYVYGASSNVQTANGALTITGTGGAGTGTNNPGVAVEQGGVRTTGTGAINVTGVGGFEGSGVVVSGTTGTIRTTNGNITVTGTGGGGGANDIVGVLVTNISGGGTIASTGTGQVTMTGTGGSSTGDGNTGIRVEGAGSSVSTISGALALTGNGGAGAGDFNNGIVLLNGGAVSTAGGFLTFDGNAGGGGNASGVVLQSGASITTTGGGSMMLDGTGTTNLGLAGNSANTITAGGTVTLISNNGIAFDTVDIVTPGALIVTSSFADVQLGGAGNSVGGAVSITASGGGNANLTNTSATLLGATNISGDFFITSGGAITQSGGAALNVGGAADFVATSGNLTLTNATNNMIGSVALTTVSGDVNYVSSGALMLGAAGVGGNLTVTAGGDLLQVGTLSVSGTTNVSVGAHLINLSNNNTFSGAVTLSNSGANNVTVVTTGNLDIAGSNVGSGTLTLQAGATGAGILTQSGAIVQQAGAVGVMLQSDGNIVLNNPSNAFTGPITVVGTNGGDVSLANSTATVIGGAQTGGGDFTLMSSGAISQTGGVNVGDLNLTASGSITMNDPFNFAGDVSLTTTGGGNAIYNEVGATVLKNVNVSGTLTVLADSGSITQATGSTLFVSGTTDLTATTGGAISLSEANSFGGAVTLTAAAGVNITALQTVAGGGFTANAGDTVTVGSGGGIATSGGAVAINTTSNIAFNSGSIASNGGNIDLIDGSSSYIGIELLFSNINAGGGNITLQGQGGSSGSNQAGIWVGSGTTVTTSGAGAITLTGTGGATTGSGNVGVFVYGGTVQTTGSGLLTVTGTGGGLTASSGTNYGVSVQAGGQISATGTGAIVVTGNGSAGGGSGSSNAGVVIDGSGSKIETGIGDVTVTGTGGTSTGANNNGIQIANGGYIGTTAGGDLTVSGTGTGANGYGVRFNIGGGTGGIVSIGGGAVSVAGIGSGSNMGISSAGSTSIVGGGSATGSIELASNGLDIDTGIAIQTSGTVSVTATSPATTLGLLDSASAVNVTAAALANISSGTLEIGGAGQTGAVTVGTDGAVTVTGNLGLYSSGAGSNGIFVAGALTTTGNLNFHTTDSVIQAAPLTVGGTTSIIADNGIFLSDPGNAMTGTISFASSAGNVMLNNTGATVFGASSVNGTLDVAVTGGSLSQLGAISVGGDTTVMSDAAIAWTNASNAFGGALYLSNTGNGNVAFAATGPILLGDVSMSGTGTFTVMATNGISQQGGAMLTTGTGAVSLAGGSGTIMLGEATNAFGSSISLSGASGALVGTVNGATGAAAAALVTASTAGFTFNGIAAGTPVIVPTTTTQTTQQTLNEISSVAPIDSATRVTVPTVDSVGSSPSVEATLSASTSDLSGGGTGGTGGGTTTASGGTSEESSGTTTVAGGPAPATQSGGTPAPTGAPGPTGGSAPPAIVVSDSGGSTNTANDVRPGPAPQPGPVTLVPGVLVSNPPSVPGGTPAGGVAGISTNFPGTGNF